MRKKKLLGKYLVSYRVHLQQYHQYLASMHWYIVSIGRCFGILLHDVELFCSISPAEEPAYFV